MTSSFPSGHAATDLAFTLGAAQKLPVVAIPLALGTSAAHWSLVRSRGHYPSDVLVGGVIGVVVAATAWVLWRPSRGNRSGSVTDGGSSVRALAVSPETRRATEKEEAG